MVEKGLLLRSLFLDFLRICRNDGLTAKWRSLPANSFLKEKLDVLVPTSTAPVRMTIRSCQKPGNLWDLAESRSTERGILLELVVTID